MTTEADSADLLRRGVNLEQVTVGWNVVGIVVLAVAALAARSVALVGGYANEGGGCLATGGHSGSTTPRLRCQSSASERQLGATRPDASP